MLHRENPQAPAKMPCIRPGPFGKYIYRKPFKYVHIATWKTEKMVRASKDAVTDAAQPPARTSATFASAATVQAPTTFALALKSDCLVCYPEVQSVRRTGPV